MVWKRTAKRDVKRTEQERDELFRAIILQNDWIVEGSPRKSLRESFERCDYIIVLDISTGTRLKRVFLRWIRQKMGKEKYNSRPTVLFLLYNIKWVFEFNKMRGSLFAELDQYQGRFVVFHDDEEAYNFVVKIYDNKDVGGKSDDKLSPFYETACNGKGFKGTAEKSGTKR